MSQSDVPDELSKKHLDSNLSDLLEGLSDEEFSRLLSGNPLAEIPYFKVVVGFWRAARDIRDRIFMAKVASFLKPLPQVSSESWNDFRQKAKQDPGFAKKLGSTLVVLLDKMDDLEKASLLSKVFLAALEKRIAFDDFRRIGSSIDLAFTDDLKTLVATNDSSMLSGYAEHLGNLLRSGLTEVVVPAQPNSTPRIITVGNSRIAYRLTKTGVLFVFALTGVWWGDKKDFPNVNLGEIAAQDVAVNTACKG